MHRHNRGRKSALYSRQYPCRTFPAILKAAS
nr:MAG TPA: NUAM protein [Bacteriophage sp.]DAF38430.1 MAG TPA: NUAM protein [Caudoviricetes sp.]DAU97413.1 MAG TPA: NUAM protein [Caudoviricetes sp.]